VNFESLDKCLINSHLLLHTPNSKAVRLIAVADCVTHRAVEGQAVTMSATELHTTPTVPGIYYEE